MKQIVFSLFVLWSNFLIAQNINYSEHIAPIIYKNCTSCHREGEIAPFPLTNYNEVTSFAQMIKYVTSIKYMPPWKPDHKFSNFQGENYLTDNQISMIKNWVDNGTPKGDPSLEPPLPVFPKGSLVGAPDKVLSFSQKWLHKGNNKDEYRYFVLPTGLTEDKDLVGLEFRPGNSPIVHHILAWADTTGKAAAEDAKTPEYGYESDENSAFAVIDEQLPGFVPGQRPLILSHGISQRLKKGSDIKLQVHYAPTASDETDSTTLNLFFAKTKAKRYLKTKVMLPFGSVLLNGPFTIPAKTVKEFHGIFNVPEKVSILSISPHMHKLGQHWIVYAVTPNNDTVNLIRINEWDFNWQGTYAFKKPIILPKGSVIHALAKYDNTTANPSNPFNPPKFVTWGEGTNAEMYYLPISWVTYQAGDENLVFEENATALDDPRFQSITTQLYPIAPNPASQQVKVGFTLVYDGKIDLSLYDLSGRLTKKYINKQLYNTGLHTFDIDVSDIRNGIYILSLEVNGKVSSQKLMVSH